MGRYTKAIGRTIKRMEEDALFMQMEMSITESGKTIRLMASVFTTTQTAQDMKGNGLRINSMVRVRKSGQIMPATRATTGRARSTDTASSCGLTGQPTLVLLWTTILKEQECTLGRTAVNLMVSGATTRCTAAECLRGTMADVMRASTSTIRSMETASSPGQMVVSTRASGKMESSTVSALTTQAKARSRRASGQTESASNGLKMINEFVFMV